MSHAKNRLFVLAALAGVALGGCSLDQADPDFPDSAQPTTFNALFNLSNGSLPWPTDLLFVGTTDGTINTDTTDPTSPLFSLGKLPFTAQGAALGALDGFSTSAPIGASFNQAIDPESLGPQSVIMIELKMAQPNIPSGVTRPLTYGEDFEASVGQDLDSYGKILRITPLKPLKASSGPIVAPLDTVGYLVLLTNQIRDTSGNVAEPDTTYAAFRGAPPGCTTFTGLTQQLCQLTQAQLGIAQAVGLDPSTIVLSWTVTTQSVDDVFKVIAQLAQRPQPITVAPTGKTTADILPAGYPGLADVYKGTTVVPYYLGVPASANDPSILNKPWVAAGASLVPGFDPASRHLTRYNPIPQLTADVTVPVLVTVPNARANFTGGGCPKPPAGWPVAVFQHGYPRDRTDALLMADALAQGCIIMAAIDQPLHGIADPANGLVTNAASALLYDPVNERTFNLDLINNATGASGPDGKTDPSGSFSLNGNFLVTRDNSRQGSADLMTFFNTVTRLDVTGDGQPDVDPSRVHFITLSLGGIVGVSAVHFSPQVRTASIADSGGVLTRLIRDSPRQWGAVRRLLTSQGLTENSVLFNNTWDRDVQTIYDAADPVNHIAAAAASKPMIMSRVVGDTNVPNSAFDRLALAGGFTQTSTAGLTPIAPGAGKFVSIAEGQGGHGSIIYPYPNLEAATFELQSEAVKFAASVASPPFPPGGPFLVIDNTSVLEPAD